MGKRARFSLTIEFKVSIHLERVESEVEKMVEIDQGL